MKLIVLLLIIVGMKSFSLEYYKKGTGLPVLFVISGIHGDESSSIEFLESIKDISITRGTIIIVPKAYKDAVEQNVRSEYFATDLNRSFFKENKDKTGKISKEIIKLIEQYQPNIILDFHESWYNYDEDKDYNFYMGNTLIFSEKTSEKINDFIFKLISERGLIPILHAKSGSLAKEIPENMDIPVLVVESSKEDSVQKRKKLYEYTLQETLLYLKME
ncbi:M99 family carboxypeptidase catalytic domain-containing protein [Fusobacterium sp. PH5-44]|uniref:M99 family carboxypeptidase catalytic domain-containing protein n=1 Tax=unclassified Fusobacterium TaxID=2648384 RepID=UPI003D24D397